MNELLEQPFTQQGHALTNSNFDDVAPLVKLWALRILAELGGSRDFICDSNFNHPWIAKHLGFSEALLSGQFNSEQAHQELAQLHAQIEQQHAQQVFSLNPVLQFNLQRLQALLGLNQHECLILGFVIVLNSEQLLDDVADTLGSLTAAKAMKALAIILDLPFDTIRQALSNKGSLHRSGLMSVQQHYSEYLRNKLSLVSNQLVDKLLVETHDVMELFVGTINRCATAELSLDDFPHLAEQLAVLLAYLQHAQQHKQLGINIFIYGASGTGKTQLCQAIAQHLQLPLYEIAYEDDDGDAITATGRLCAYRAAQSIFDDQTALLMFDEVEDVFNDTENGAGMKSTAQSRKAWVNRMLEQNQTPTLWVSNSEQLDPAFIRRFDLVIEVQVPPKKQRMRMIQQHCDHDLTADYQTRLASVEHLSPAVLRRAYRVARSAKVENNNLAVEPSMTQLISNTLKAQGYPVLKQYDAHALPAFYDLDFIHTKANLAQISQGIAAHGFGRLCLYGPSGTGKTAFARWLAEYIDQPLLVKRGSDLLSPWVGEVEQNLAKAFAEAEQQQAVLLLDEVDSLLQNRQQAVRSWEISQVNEFLVQMEGFNGVLICTTNRFEDLDQAALRRFDFKLHFDYLNYAQRWALLQKVAQQLKIAVSEQEVSARLQRLNKLCAGDFAVIVRQAYFHGFADADALLQHLADEMAVKNPQSTAIGFHPDAVDQKIKPLD
ncbi:AAA family ATPase [Acinetobacter larvae]|uniref:AAA family ATPase n=1 Tax=Acinetobacter larvae TaxID=1789224 RepID=A0A1B2LVH4_9GAMM|nr:ATP-binding protein [Acinetobacter larvae]AOA56918.1 AAA family ATPase [Acinetobacter larvae]